MNSEIESAIKATQGNLIIGNHDSLLLLGAKPQADLRDCSRTISKLLLESSIDIDVTISDVVYEIQNFQDAFGVDNYLRKHKAIMKKYSLIFKMLDNVSLYLKLQQAQLIKEIKMLENLKLVISGNITSLENCLYSAKETLSTRTITRQNTNDVGFDIGNDLDTWYSRLEGRIEDLNISHTVSLQSQAQITLLIDNNRSLIDKIASAISNTIPIWQNQMALLLGVELLEKRMEVQSKVIEIADSYLNKNTKKKKRSIFGKRNDYDLEQLLSLNQRIKFVLSEIEQSQNQDKNIRNTLQNLLIER